MSALVVWWNRRVMGRVLMVPTGYGMSWQFCQKPFWIKRSKAHTFVMDNLPYWRQAA